MKKVICLFLAILLIASLGLSGCGSANQTPKETTPVNSTAQPDATSEAPSASAEPEKKDPVTIRFSWWGEQIRHNATLEAIKIFQTKYPHITVETEFSGWDGYYQKLTTQVATNTAPDVYQCGLGTAEFTAMIRDGSAEELQPYVDKGILDFSDLSPSVVDLSKFEGKLYSIMPGTSATGLAVNMDLLEQAGLSLPPEIYSIDDLYKWLKEFHDKTGVYGIKTWKPEYIFGMYLVSQNLSEYTADEKLGYDEALLTRCFADALKWQEEGITPTLDQEYQNLAFEDSPFVEGKCLTQIINSGQFNVLDELTETKKPLGYIPLPHVDMKTQLEGWGVMYGMSANSEHKDEAATLINFLLNDMDAGLALGFTRAVPVSAKVRESLNGKLNETDNIALGLMNVASKYARTFKDPEKPAYAAYAVKYMKDAQEEVLFKVSTPEKAAKDFFEKVNKAYEDYMSKKK